ncbi:MAG: hypothetical protein COW88_01225 [Candidatus Lloydbacteria bacterium CG22_combo_CG10-13_8_21_14_all_47_15]|uniref:Uncharacterized protein n=1 Tax=Candidatus Lloydbacteria bacterium CG22_combo_CG10-13_8_21_14_all_47_15 TaxID=1974635 RepID=A0A2H0CUN2_9BACT|nr:MAG: hypothetical protein COW88_01225 [Candidatus Lloydbacteria bacterium CG22_combo_CG10-13_8_21_14_all_47_15]
MEERTTHFKEKLFEEKLILEKELAQIGRINPDNPADWESRPAEESSFEPDSNIVADRIEGYEANTAVSVELENRLGEVNAALGRIEANTYGICEAFTASGERIEDERLEANPAARTCKTHKEEKVF